MLPLGPLGYKRPVPFRRLLAELLALAPGARGAVFCDYEGENVDVAVAEAPPPGCALLSVYDVKVVGAQFAAVWLLLEERGTRQGAGGVRELKLRAERGTMLCHRVKDGYYLALLLGPDPRTELAAAVLRRAAERFALEM